MRTAILGTMFIACACAEPPSDDAPVQDDSLHAQLARGVTFELADADASVHATFHHGDTPDEADVSLDVVDGAFAAWSYEDMLSVSASIALAPIALPSELHGALSLVDVAVTIDATCAAMWTDAATCTTTADAVVSWSLASDDGVYPLGDLVIDDLDVTARVTGDRLELTGAAPGSRWSWAGVFELGDIALDLSADAQDLVGGAQP